MTAEAANELSMKGRSKRISTAKDFFLEEIRKQAEAGFFAFSWPCEPEWVREPVVEMLRILGYEVSLKAGHRCTLVQVRW